MKSLMAMSEDKRKSGIYKVTNPVGEAYIGKAVDLKARLTSFMLMYSSVERQPKLWGSLKQYGAKEHQYDVLEECVVVDLPRLEADYKLDFVFKHGWEKALFYRIEENGIVMRDPSIVKKKTKRRPNNDVVMRHFMNGTLENVLYDGGYYSDVFDEAVLKDIVRQLSSN